MSFQKIHQTNPFIVLDDEDTAPLEKVLLDERGILRSVPFAALEGFSQNRISCFCHRFGVYQIVTTELVEFVRGELEGFSSAIEIGAGNGCLGRALGIPMVDNRMQEWKDIRYFYRSIGQPTVVYGADVRRLDAVTAVNVMKPEAAVGAWVTHKFKKGFTDGNFAGVDDALLARKLRRYVFIGNEKTHANKEMLRLCEPRAYKFDWLVSRSLHREKNVIWIFDFPKKRF